MADTRWQCPECESKWPTATTIDAVANIIKAQSTHPGIQCYEIVGPEISGINATNKYQELTQLPTTKEQ